MNIDTFDNWETEADVQKLRNERELQAWRDRKYNDWMTAVDEQIGLRSQGKYTVDNVPRLSYPQAFDAGFSQWHTAANAMRLIQEFGPINMQEEQTR